MCVCVSVMVDFLLWFPALNRDYGCSVGHTMVLLIHGSDTQLIILNTDNMGSVKYTALTDHIAIKFETNLT